AILLGRGETRNAIGQFRAAIDAKPDDARAYYNLGLALEKAGDSEAARAAFQHALKLDPQLKTSAPDRPEGK
ncbi:MAG TPA: tetratricopeptide repeat protein, partial [Terriglobia bacterium]|nr:tetratricopeptide repeat protein [Terriglobia bacterium]